MSTLSSPSLWASQGIFFLFFSVRKGIEVLLGSWCEVCQGFLWGIGGHQGSVCADCGLVVHVSCQKTALSSIPCSEIRIPTTVKDSESVAKSLRDGLGPCQSNPFFFFPFFFCTFVSLLCSSLFLFLSFFFEQRTVQGRELQVLYLQFQKIDTNGDGFISLDEFQHGLGTVLNEPFFANALFRVLDSSKDGLLDFGEFVSGMGILMKGSVEEQLKRKCLKEKEAFLSECVCVSVHICTDENGATIVAFELCSPGDDGYVLRDVFEKLVAVIDRSLGSIKVEREELVKKVFERAQDDKLSLQQFMEVAKKERVFIQSLGLLKEDQSPQRIGKKGIPIGFGHTNWDLMFHIMLGIRISVGEATSKQQKIKEISKKDFELQVEYELKTYLPLSHSLFFSFFFFPAILNSNKQIQQINGPLGLPRLCPARVSANSNAASHRLEPVYSRLSSLPLFQC
jgi:Ca2+-binding EF-hand superfamily protein